MDIKRILMLTFGILLFIFTLLSLFALPFIGDIPPITLYIIYPLVALITGFLIYKGIEHDIASSITLTITLTLFSVQMAILSVLPMLSRQLGTLNPEAEIPSIFSMPDMNFHILFSLFTLLYLGPFIVELILKKEYKQIFFFIIPIITYIAVSMIVKSVVIQQLAL